MATGAVAVFVSTNTTGTAALIAAGVVLVAIATYGDRIETVEAAGVKVALSKLAAADRAEAAGDVATADRLRGEAADLLEEARSLATRYKTIRATKASSWERTAQLEALLRQSHALAATYSPKAVRELFRSGDEGNRIIALGMMTANPDLADAEVVAQAVSNSRTAFEQYHALKAAETLANLRPRAEGMALVREALQQMLSSGKFEAAGSDRGNVARRVLDLLC